MKIGILSDLHFDDWRPGVFTFKPEPDVFYVLAGDFFDGLSGLKQKWFNKWLDQIFGDADNYMVIKGNHDYFMNFFPKEEDDLVNRTWNGVKFAGATLWTDLSNWNDWTAYQSFMDEGFINLSYDNYNRKFQSDKMYLLSSGADVIVSHHCPSALSVDKQYKGNALNPAFYSELYEDILGMPKPPKLWIHGHTHIDHDYMIGSTRVVCHPRGYQFEGKVEYQPKIVEIDIGEDIPNDRLDTMGFEQRREST